jgi:hypothetical protein
MFRIKNVRNATVAKHQQLAPSPQPAASKGLLHGRHEGGRPRKHPEHKPSLFSYQPKAVLLSKVHVPELEHAKKLAPSILHHQNPAALRKVKAERAA